MTLKSLRSLDVSRASLFIWVFKKTLPANTAPRFTGRWIATTDRLDEKLKNIIATSISSIYEEIEYGLLTQNDEGSVLTINKDGTHAPLILAHCGGGEITEKKISNVKDLNNSEFYVIKVVSGDNVLFGFKKSGPSWKTKAAKDLTSIIFSDQSLDLKEEPTFNLSNSIDFFVYEKTIFILNEPNFESILSYKAAHIHDFAALQAEPHFRALFSDIRPLVQNVGSHKIQLKRMAAIRQREHYRCNVFLNNLRVNYSAMGLNINFDDNGKIIVCSNTWRDIITALLDHRLVSRFSDNIYDVADTKNINVRS